MRPENSPSGKRETMWRRVCSQLAPWRYAAPGSSALRNRAAAAAFISSSPSPSSFQKTGPLYSADSDNASLKTSVEDVMPIATGNERDEIEGRKIFVDMEAPVGPFGTKEPLLSSSLIMTGE